MNGFDVSWPLCSAVARSQARTLRRIAGSMPLPAVAAVGAWGFSVVVVLRIGGDAANALGPVLTDPVPARAVVVGLAISCGAGGAALALTARGVEALGGAIASAPLSRVSAHRAAVAPRLVLALVLTVPLVLAAVLPLAAATPGGPVGAAALVAVLAASVAVAALVAESVLRLARQPRLGAADAGAALAAAGLVVASELAARGLAGSSREGVVAVAAGLALSLGAGATWTALSSDRPPARPRDRRARIRSSVVPVIDASAGAVLARAADVRLALGASVSFGLVGIGAGVVVAGPAGGLLLASGVAAVGAGIAPLSAAGRIDVGRWAWSAGAPSRVAIAWGCASALSMLAVVGPIAAVGAALGAGLPAVLHGVTIAVAVWAAAIAAGSLAPRRAADLADDAASLVAFVAVLSVGMVAGDAVRAWLGELGTPAGVALWLWLVVASAGAALGLWIRVRGS